jgi:plastocyanin
MARHCAPGDNNPPSYPLWTGNNRCEADDYYLGRDKLRLARLYAVITIVFCAIGCGGGSGSSDRSSEVSVISTKSSPGDLTIPLGDKITWINDTSSVIKIVSGTLSKVASPTSRDVCCLAGGSFSPDSFDADFGDTIVWQNMDTENSIIVEVLNSSNKVIKSLSIEPLMTGSYSGFPRAGQYTYHIYGSAESGSLTLYGVPTPDGKFESMYLAEGKKHSAYLFQSGFQSYYIVKQNSADTSCITAQINVL